MYKWWWASIYVTRAHPWYGKSSLAISKLDDISADPQIDRPLTRHKAVDGGRYRIGVSYNNPEHDLYAGGYDRTKTWKDKAFAMDTANRIAVKAAEVAKRFGVALRTPRLTSPTPCI